MLDPVATLQDDLLLITFYYLSPMDFGLQLGTSQRLEQTLSPQLRQFVTILQKNSLELDTAIKEELESNPLL